MEQQRGTSSHSLPSEVSSLSLEHHSYFMYAHFNFVPGPDGHTFIARPAPLLIQLYENCAIITTI